MPIVTNMVPNKVAIRKAQMMQINMIDAQNSR